MKLDSPNSYSAADEIKSFPASESHTFPKGKHVSASDQAAGAAIRKYSDVMSGDNCTSWSYLFVHNQKTKAIELLLKADRLTYFIHKSIKYVKRSGSQRGVREVAVPSVSGLIFLQGDPKRLQTYLDENVPHHRLCKNCSTGEVAVIPDSQMKPFMRVAEMEPDRIRFLLRPFAYYAKNRTLLRIVSGDYAGLEGYVIRIARDRRLVMNVGGMSVAVSGVHAERFEEVGKNEATKKERAIFYKRNLQERNAFIDRYFHKVTTVHEVAAQAENIELLRVQTLSDVKNGKMDIKAAYETFYFIIEEIGYYYAPFIDMFKGELKPIFEAGNRVMCEIDRIISSFTPEDEYRLRCETEYEELKANYRYLFEY